MGIIESRRHPANIVSIVYIWGCENQNVRSEGSGLWHLSLNGDWRLRFSGLIYHMYYVFHIAVSNLYNDKNIYIYVICFICHITHWVRNDEYWDLSVCRPVGIRRPSYYSYHIFLDFQLSNAVTRLGKLRRLFINLEWWLLNIWIE